MHSKTPLLNNTTAEVTNDQLGASQGANSAPNTPKLGGDLRNSSVSITSQNEVTYQEKISTIIQTLLGIHHLHYTIAIFDVLIHFS